MNNMNHQEMIEHLRGRLSAHRLQHSLDVAAEAHTLASQYGLDQEKAYTIGLLHDYAKGMSGASLLALAEEHDLIEDETERQVPDLLHAPVGAFLLETELGIGDPELLQAVTVHTLGSMNMSAMDKIIYLADTIEPSRDYPGLERIKCMAGRDLDQAMLLAMDATIRYCLEKGRILHPRTIMVRNNFLVYIKKNKKNTI